MSRFGPNQDRQMTLACLPFSKPERIEGAWYWGFELNSFLEGGRASLKNLEAAQRSRTSLEFYDPHLPADGRVRAMAVQFIGRRSQCRMYPDHLIIVDHMISSAVKAVSG
jgi:hypothetical protein